MKFYLPLLVSTALLQVSLAAQCRPQVLPPDTQPTCVVKGCNSELCTDQNITSSCTWHAEFACYQNTDTICERDQTTNECGWRQTESLASCLADPPTYTLGPVVSSECRPDGCNGRLCTDRQVNIIECIGENGDLCYYGDFAVCERDQVTGQCGWRQTDDLKECLTNPPTFNQ